MPGLAIVALIAEILGIALAATGIGIELKSGASPGFLFVTVGACLIAIGALIWAKVLKS